MSNKAKFLKYAEQFNELSHKKLYELGYRFELSIQEMQLLLMNNGWKTAPTKPVYYHPNRKDPNSLIDNTDFKPKDYNTKPIKYRRK